MLEKKCFKIPACARMTTYGQQSAKITEICEKLIEFATETTEKYLDIEKERGKIPACSRMTTYGQQSAKSLKSAGNLIEFTTERLKARNNI